MPWEKLSIKGGCDVVDGVCLAVMVRPRLTEKQRIRAPDEPS